MKTDHPTIVDLRAKLAAAVDEFGTAMACHEVWKPAAYDKELLQRMGKSFATNTFLVIRQVLRRETLLALMRLWDRNRDAVGMEYFARALEQQRVMDALVMEYEAHWSGLPPQELEDIPLEDRATCVEAARRNEVEFGRKKGAELRKFALEAIELINSYARTGARSATLGNLKKLRNERLAHRQVTSNAAKISRANSTDEEIESFYSDMSRLIHLLRLAIDHVDYDPEATALLHRRHAALFWAGVRGERTEGHPNYQSPRVARADRPR